MESLLNFIPENYAVFWILMLIVTIGVLIVLIPKICKYFNKIRIYVNNIESLSENIKQNTKDIETLFKRLGEEDNKMEVIDKILVKQQQCLDDSLEERELILRSLLGVVQGLQEIGANGPTKATEKDIQEFLLKKFHQVDTGDK